MVTGSQDALTRYLTRDFHVLPSGDRVQSSYWAAWRDACNVSGRDEQTGKVNSEENTLSWIGAIAWLCLIEQLGNAVQLSNISAAQLCRIDKHTKVGSEHNFRAALVQFVPTAKDWEISALWALRNSLAHDYRLVNEHKRDDLCHHFVLRSSADGPLVRKEGQPPRTYVDLWRLGDTGVEAALSAEKFHARGELKINGDSDSHLDQYFSRCF
jgi:hypothetical protein